MKTTISLIDRLGTLITGILSAIETLVFTLFLTPPLYPCAKPRAARMSTAFFSGFPLFRKT
jgi:hypothetical protein